MGQANCEVVLNPAADFFFEIPQRTASLNIPDVPEIMTPYSRYVGKKTLPASTNPDEHNTSYSVTGIGTLINRQRYAKGIHKPKPDTAGCAGHTNCGCNPFDFIAGTITDRAMAEKYCHLSKPVCLEDQVLTRHYKKIGSEYIQEMKRTAIKMPHTILRTILADESIKVLFSRKLVEYGKDGVSMKLPFYMNPNDPTKWPTEADLVGAGLTKEDVCMAPNMQTIYRYFLPRIFSPKRHSRTTSAHLMGTEMSHETARLAHIREYKDYYNLNVGDMMKSDMPDPFKMKKRMENALDHELFNVDCVNGCFEPVTPCAMFESPDGFGEIEDFNPRYSAVKWQNFFLLPNDWIKLNPLQLMLNDPHTGNHMQDAKVQTISHVNGSYLYSIAGKYEEWCAQDPNNPTAGKPCSSLGLNDSIRFAMIYKAFMSLGRTRPYQFIFKLEDERPIEVFTNKCEGGSVSVEPKGYGRGCCKLPGGRLALNFSADKLAEKGLEVDGTAFYQTSAGKWCVTIVSSQGECTEIKLKDIEDSTEYCCDEFDLVCPPKESFDSVIDTAVIDAEGGTIKFDTELLLTPLAEGATGTILCCNDKEVKIVLTAESDGCSHCAELAEDETCTLEGLENCDIERVMFDAPGEKEEEEGETEEGADEGEGQEG